MEYSADTPNPSCILSLIYKSAVLRGILQLFSEKYPTNKSLCCLAVTS